MNTCDKWNLIVENVKKNLSVKEGVVQKLWEDFFADSSFFGYSKFSGEIDAQRNIQIGASERTIPDIIIKDIKNNKDLFAVELKQHSLSFHPHFRDQLFSYLKLLRLNVGILVCDRIHLFVLNDDDSEISMEIPFIRDSADGERFVELFSKGNFSVDEVKDFISAHKERKERIAQIKKDAQALRLEDLLMEHFSSNYSDDEIKQAISELKLSAQPVLFPSPSTVSSPAAVPLATIPAPRTRAKHTFNDDFTFTNAAEKLDHVKGYKAFNSANENIGIIFPDNDKRGKSYECCVLHMYPSFRSRYGTWHIIESNGHYVTWVDFCNQLSASGGSVTMHID